MKVIFDDGKEIEFDENEVGTLQDPRERIFKKDGIWYITKIINKDFAKWLDETKPMIIEEEMCHKCHKYPAEHNQTYCEFCLGISKEEKKRPLFEEKDKEIEKLTNKLNMIKKNIDIVTKEEIIDIIDNYTGFFGKSDKE